ATKQPATTTSLTSHPLWTVLPKTGSSWSGTTRIIYARHPGRQSLLGKTCSTMEFPTMF
ncbi:unnamed protein product, partial [Heterosigma akashiwo]